MKKLFGSLVAVLFVLVIAVSPVAAMGGYHEPVNVNASGDTSHGVGYETSTYNGGYAGSWAGADYDANGRNYANGAAQTDGSVYAVDFGNGGNFGFSAAGANTEASANTYSDRYGRDYVSVSGGVEQGNGASAFDENNKGWAGANGGNTSGGDFEAYDNSWKHAHVVGGAETGGVTLVGAYTTHHAGYTTSVAGGLTSNQASAYRDCYGGGASVYGSGEMNTGTFASTNRGVAWTTSNANFTYNDSGRFCANKAGSAYGVGYSNVTHSPNGVTASSYTTSGAFSTGDNQ